MIIEGSAEQVDLNESLTTVASVSATDRAIRFGQQAAVVTLSGGSDELRKTLLFSLENVLFEQGRAVVALSADQLGNDAAGAAAALRHAGLITLLETSDQLEGALALDLDQLQGDSAVAKLAAALEQLQ